MNKVYIFCPNFPGVKTHLEHIAKLLKENSYSVTFFARRFNLDLIDDNSTIIFGGWVAEYNRAFQLLKSQKRNIKILLLWCSPLSQMILENDFNYFLEAASNPYIDHLLLSRDEGKTLKKIYPKIEYIPAPYYITEDSIHKRKKHHNFNISMFNSNTPRKNGYVQVVALKEIQNVLLYSNFAKNGIGLMLTNLAKLIGINNINKSWIEDDKYMDIISNTDLGLQVTFCEGFNYVLAEHFSYSVPVLTSAANPIIGNNEMIHKYLVVRDIASIDEITSRIKIIQEDEKLRTELGIVCKEQIISYCKWANKLVLKVLKGII